LPRLAASFGGIAIGCLFAASSIPASLPICLKRLPLIPPLPAQWRGLTAQRCGIVTSIWSVQIFLAGLPIILVFCLGLGAVGLAVSAYLILPHVQSRVDRFLDPASGDNYQIERSMEAFMSGGIMGRGPGEGWVKNSIPDAHSDFIFAVAGEEFGLLFCVLVVGVFTFIIMRGLSRLMGERNLFVVLAVTGILVQFGLQAVINMASTLQLVPPKGMTLPFVSYGGSATIGIAIGMGFVLALTRKRPGE